MKVYIVIEEDGFDGWNVATYSTYEKAKDHAEDLAEYMDLVQLDKFTWTSKDESACVMIQEMTVVD